MRLGYKRIILDYHFSEFLPETLSAVDPREYVERMKDAGIEAFLVYAKDHWGNVYHRTSVSHQHRNAPEDLFGDLLRLCRENGIAPYAYTTVLWDEHSARGHPEWLAVDPEGNPVTQGSVWHTLCVNTPYRDFFYRQLDELAANYDFDVLFVDILFYFANGIHCYCDACRPLWREMYGSEMPAPMTPADRLRYTRFRDAFYRDFYAGIRRILALHGKEDCLVTHNHGGTDPSLPTYIGKETEPFGLDYIAPQVVIKESANRAAGRDVEIYFGRFNSFWDFTVKSPELLRWEVVNAFAHDCAATIIDQPLLDGRLDPAAGEAIGWAYEQAGPLLRFTRDTEPYAEIAVYYDHVNYECSVPDGVEDLFGACKLLAEWHYPYDLLTDFDDPSRLARYRAVVLPSARYVSPRMRLALLDYVRGGGTVVCDYQAGVWDENGDSPGSRHFLFDVENQSVRTAHYIRPSEPRGGTYLRVGESMEIVSHPGDLVLGDLHPIALERDEERWVSHNTPPALAASCPAAVVRQLGQGRVLYFAPRVFREYLSNNLRSLRDFLKGSIGEVYRPDIRIEAPSIVDAFYRRDGDRLVVTLNCCTLDRGSSDAGLIYGTKAPRYMNINESYPISGIRLVSRQPIGEVGMLDGTVLEPHPAGDLYVVELPPVDGFTALRLATPADLLTAQYASE